MKEDLIQYFWKSKFLVQQQLLTTRGEKLLIRSTGTFNTDQGPDFLFAQIEIDGVIWVGHVEIHIRASDWNTHGHDADPHYSNTILHVVWESNKEICLNGNPLACLEVKNLFPSELLTRYDALMHSGNPVPCHHHLTSVSQSLKNIHFESLMVERFEMKTKKMMEDWLKQGSDWEALLFCKVATYLVAPVNSKAMECLLQQIPYSLLTKYRHEVFLLEALLLGASGLLNNQDPYAMALSKEFHFLQKKHHLNVLNPVQWKFLRMRPAHFPTLRLAQLASLLYHRQAWFSYFLNSNELKDFFAFFKLEPSVYWKTHYHFGKTSSLAQHKLMGEDVLNIVFINAIFPILFAYGSAQCDQRQCQKALRLIEETKVESNRITQMWKNYNFVLRHAGHSQAGIQLYQTYCVPKKCTSCMIGNVILKSGCLSDSNQAYF